MVSFNNKYCVIRYSTKDGGTMYIDCYSSYQTFNSTLVSFIIGLGTKYFKIKDDGVNIYFYWSNDGVTFIEAYTVAKANGYLGENGYNTIVYGVDANNFEVATLLEQWIETALEPLS
jgi:hypothetical protein